jgi:hypothetical protein
MADDVIRIQPYTTLIDGLLEELDKFWPMTERLNLSDKQTRQLADLKPDLKLNLQACKQALSRYDGQTQAQISAGGGIRVQGYLNKINDAMTTLSNVLRGELTGESLVEKNESTLKVHLLGADGVFANWEGKDIASFYESLGDVVGGASMLLDAFTQPGRSEAQALR